MCSLFVCAVVFLAFLVCPSTVACVWGRTVVAGCLRPSSHAMPALVSASIVSLPWRPTSDNGQCTFLFPFCSSEKLSCVMYGFMFSSLAADFLVACSVVSVSLWTRKRYLSAWKQFMP